MAVVDALFASPVETGDAEYSGGGDGAGAGDGGGGEDEVWWVQVERIKTRVESAYGFSA